MYINLTWLAVVGVTALLSGVLARAKAVASSLCVIGRGPVAPLWLRDTGRIPAEAPALLEGPAGLPCCIHVDTQEYIKALCIISSPKHAIWCWLSTRVTHGLEIFLIIRHALKHEASCQMKMISCIFLVKKKKTYWVNNMSVKQYLEYKTNIFCACVCSILKSQAVYCKQ